MSSDGLLGTRNQDPGEPITTSRYHFETSGLPVSKPYVMPDSGLVVRALITYHAILSRKHHSLAAIL